MHRRSRLSRRAGGAARIGVALLVTGAALTGCAEGAQVTAAPLASHPACFDASAKYPEALLGEKRMKSLASGTGVYGEPRIIVRCGVEPLGPTTLVCLEVNGVDWVVDDRQDPLVFTTFGRKPAIEVRIPTSYPKQDASSTLVDLQPAAQLLPTTSLHCN